MGTEPPPVNPAHISQSPPSPAADIRHGSEIKAHCCLPLKFSYCLLCSIIVAKANRYTPKPKDFHIFLEPPGSMTHSGAQIAVRVSLEPPWGLGG